MTLGTRRFSIDGCALSATPPHQHGANAAGDLAGDMEGLPRASAGFPECVSKPADTLPGSSHPEVG